jgi:hypothetical protein
MYTVKMGVCTVWLKVSIGLTEYSGLQPLDPIEHPDIPISVSVVMLYRRETIELGQFSHGVRHFGLDIHTRCPSERSSSRAGYGRSDASFAGMADMTAVVCPSYGSYRWELRHSFVSWYGLARRRRDHMVAF